MKKFFRGLFYATCAIYPILVFTCLVILELPVRVLSLCVAGIALGMFLSFTAGSGSEKKTINWKPIVSSLILVAVAAGCFLTGEKIFLKLYSVVISLMMLIVFGSTLFFGPCIIFRFATISDKSIRGSICEWAVEQYCRKVTIVWCLFFVVNGSVSAYTVFFADYRIWSIYNGGISYVLMGILFLVEYLIRKKVSRRMIKGAFITKFKPDSWKMDHVICFEKKWTEKKFKTWHDFLVETAVMRNHILKSSATDWILHCEDYWYFLVTFISLLQCKKRVLLTQNIAESFIDEIKTEGVEFLSDQNVRDAQSINKIIADNISLVREEEIKNIPEINAEETQILMYTSGSTGKAKAVPQRMKEFEEDNGFIISKWGQEFTKRKLVTTVSQHHIYGFLFGISLPFALGVPFRRTRIEFPEEFAALSDESYIIIATPAFLKRTVDVVEKVPVRDPWIFTSGGAVSEVLAKDTERVFGFCPLEVYGSTETSGIAYRQQKKDKLVWTPFDNAKVWKGDDGCLRIISPYIKNPEGFATADLVEFTGEGQKFILKGRSDSIVKIEEKRISMTEVEERLFESGLVCDVKVVALTTEIRQCLAAAVVLNENGKKQFKDTEKYLINRYFHDYLMKFFENVVIPKKWRFVDSLPTDVQGKKHKDEIIAMFSE